MRNTTLAGLGLGLVAAIVFASATTGSLLIRYLLFFITPLPLALAALGWGWRAGAIAGITGVAIIALVARPDIAAYFAMSQVAPMVVLCYLAGLSRPLALPPGYLAANEPPPLEWYPAGRLVLWAAVMAGTLAAVALVLLGSDIEDLRKALAEFISAYVKQNLPDEQQKALGEDDVRHLTEIALALLPAAASMSWMSSLVFNLWLGGRVTLASSQLARPWPDLAALEYPRGTGFVFAAALLATSLEGYPGIIASSFAGGLFLAYVLLGLAIIHYTTRGQPWRPFALWACYAALLFANFWFATLIALIGLADGALHLRARFASQSPS